MPATFIFAITNSLEKLLGCSNPEKRSKKFSKALISLKKPVPTAAETGLSVFKKN